LKVMMSARDVVHADLEYICNNLREEFARLSGNKLLITGGAGFLGYYLVQAALHWNKNTGKTARPIDVTVCDNYIRGVPGWLREFEGTENLKLVKADITKIQPQELGDFQYVIHAASIASPTYYRRYPIETMDANVNGLRHLLEHFLWLNKRTQQAQGFLFFSSSEIYGDPSPENIPTSETYRGNVSCTGPRACYDEAKRYGETLCVNFAQQYDLPVKMARPFNNYGPGLKITDGRVIPDFAKSVMEGRNIVMFSDGSPRRTYCYVADAIVGYYKILVRGRQGEAYNIGVEQPEISVMDLAERIVRIAGELFDYRGKVARQASSDKDYLIDNPNRRCPVIAKARAEIGYSPSISLDEGLRRLLLWYSENRTAEEA
jgi:nucleoside-diphosphate-sugar epimerase